MSSIMFHRTSSQPPQSSPVFQPPSSKSQWTSAHRVRSARPVFAAARCAAAPSAGPSFQLRCRGSDCFPSAPGVEFSWVVGGFQLLFGERMGKVWPQIYGFNWIWINEWLMEKYDGKPVYTDVRGNLPISDDFMANPSHIITPDIFSWPHLLLTTIEFQILHKLPGKLWEFFLDATLGTFKSWCFDSYI